MGLITVVEQRWKRWGNNRRVWTLNRLVTELTQATSRIGVESQQPPVVFFNASTRINGISQNAAFSLLAALGLQLAGVSVVHFFCRRGMSRCVLGAAYHGIQNPPPCRICIAQSRPLFANAPAIPFEYEADQELTSRLRDWSVEQLVGFTCEMSTCAPFANRHSSHPGSQVPLGSLVLPSVRWALRRHHLDDDENTRFLLREFILSASGIARQFDTMMEKTSPQAVVVFNGQFYPEATARWVAQQRGIRVITHEVGLRPFSAFFTDGEATAYPLEIPDTFVLSELQNACLDEYLAQRFQGNFSMAGIRFWSQMSELSDDFQQHIARFHQVVPVFTNVIFDTSQPHSNIVFPHMFAWLDQVLDLARQYPDTLFVIRAHPDEIRPGKASRESVAEWVAAQKATELPNLMFVPAEGTLSSYGLIQKSKFVMIYNSTIGLEASILGIPVLSAGKARFTQLPTVFFPRTVDEFQQQAHQFLSAEDIFIPPEYQLNARRFLYVQLFQSSLPFGDFIEEDGIWPGFVRLKRFSWHDLTPERSPAIRVIVDGLLHGKPFLLQD
jgi:hypothetical protein